MKTQIYNLYVEASEEVTTIISRLHTARAKEIALIVPQHALVLQSIINLRLLAREAQKLQRDIVIVTSDEGGITFAARAGIETLSPQEWNDHAQNGGDVTAQSVSGITSATPAERQFVDGHDSSPHVDTAANSDADTSAPRRMDFGSQNYNQQAAVLPSAYPQVEHANQSQQTLEQNIVQDTNKEYVKADGLTEAPAMDMTVGTRSVGMDIRPHNAPVPDISAKASEDATASLMKSDMESRFSQREAAPNASAAVQPVGVPDEPIETTELLFPERDDNGSEEISVIEQSKNKEAQSESVETSFSEKEQQPLKKKWFGRDKKKSKGGRYTRSDDFISDQNEDVLRKPRLLRIRYVLLLAVMGVVSYFVLPFTTMTVEVASLEQKEDLILTAKKGYTVDNPERRQIPLRVIEKSLVRKTQIAPTGKVDTQPQKAFGTLTIYNSFSGQSQNLVARTRFESPDGVIFRLTEPVTVPGMTLEGDERIPGSVEVSVVADQEGASGNVSPGRWVIPGFRDGDQERFKNFYAESVVAMAGGSAGGANNKAVTEADVAKAKQNAAKGMEQYVQGELALLVRDQEVLLNNAVNFEVVRSESAVEVGTATTSATFNTFIDVKAFVISKEDIATIAQSTVFEDIADLWVYEPTFKYSNVRVDRDDERIVFSTAISLGREVDVNIEELRSVIKGVSHDRLREVLIAEYPTVSNITLKSYPSRPDFIGSRISRYDWMTSIEVAE